MGVPPVEMGVISAQGESRPIIAPQNSYQLKQPVHNSVDQAAQFQNNQAAQPHFAAAPPQYASPPQSPLPNATGQQMPQFPQHQTQLLPQQRQIQAQMQKSHPPQLTQTGPPLPTKFQTATPLQCLNDGPAPVDCPGCGARELTRTEYDVGNTTHGWAVLCCWVTLLCCIPYMFNAFKDVSHYCSHCGMYLARWHRSGRTVVKAY